MKPGPLKTVFAGAGRFDEPGGQAAILGRLAGVTGLRGVKYWSDAREGWYRLFEDASALSGPDRDSRRENFTNDELGTGQTLHFLLDEDHLMRAVAYRLPIIENQPDRMVFEMTNVNGIGIAIFTAVDPEQFQQYHAIERETGDTWRYYSFARVSAAGFLAFMSPKSFKNRTLAFYRYVAGIPTDKEPPAAR